MNKKNKRKYVCAIDNRFYTLDGALRRLNKFENSYFSSLYYTPDFVPKVLATFKKHFGSRTHAISIMFYNITSNSISLYTIDIPLNRSNSTKAILNKLINSMLYFKDALVRGNTYSLINHNLLDEDRLLIELL